MAIRTLGVNYDTGLVVDGRSTRPVFDASVVERELRIIADDLHATAVRVSGDDSDRLDLAARYGSAAGLEIWYSPVVYDVSPDELLEYLLVSATRAEDLRHAGADVVLVLGGEISLFCSGFVPGTGLAGRLATLSDPATWTNDEMRAAITAGLRRFQDTQRTVAARVRTIFGGPITYAAGMWEDVEWGNFDIVSVDAYRDAQNSAAFADQVHAYHRYGKPVAVTEFGCCTYRGAAARGGTGWMILDDTSQVLEEGHVRDEAEPEHYFEELFDIFETAGVNAAFWFSFAGYALPHRTDDPRRDLDVASYGLVAVSDTPGGSRYPDMYWEPKRAFDALSARYGAKRAGESLPTSRHSHD